VIVRPLPVQTEAYSFQAIQVRPTTICFKHISNLGSIARLDFERCSVAGEVIYAIAGDAMPTSQQDEEARVGTLASIRSIAPVSFPEAMPRPIAFVSDSIAPGSDGVFRYSVSLIGGS
jgi:hypothetical protein